MLESELFAMLERTADAAFVISQDREIQSWNKAAERLFGYRQKRSGTRPAFSYCKGLALSERAYATKDAA